MKKFSSIAIILLAAIVSSCYVFCYDSDCAVCILCENNSDSDLWFSYDLGPNYSNPVYEVRQFSQEDTLGNIQLGILYGRTEFRQVKKNSSDLIFLMVTKNGWKYLKHYDYPDSLRIQVWDDALIQKVGWDEFVKKEGEYRYELEYVIDLGYFAKDNWADVTITYPPSGSEDYMRINYP